MMEDNTEEEPPYVAGSCGFMLKYPSEGSNIIESAKVDTIYPAKCMKCNVAWASSSSDMRAHRLICRGTQVNEEENHEPTSPKNDGFGLPRKLWFEVNFEQCVLQWREDFQSEQKPSDQVRFDSIQRITPIGECCFSLDANDGRKLVLEVDSNSDRDAWKSELESLIFISGKPPGAQDAEGIITAIGRGDTAAIDDLLTRNPALISTVDQEHNSLALIACKVGATESVLSTLIQYGANCMAVNDNDEFPLLYVSAANDIDLVNILLEQALVDPNQCSAFGVTALHAAAISGGSDVLNRLLEAGLDPYRTDQNLCTALHYAASIADGELAIHMLCEAAPGDLIDATSKDSETALHVAARSGFADTVKALLETAASTNIRNLQDKTALDLARECGHEDCLNLLGEYDTVRPPPAPVLPAAWKQVEASSNVWVQHITEDGSSCYYFNTETGESQWEIPETTGYIEEVSGGGATTDYHQYEDSADITNGSSSRGALAVTEFVANVEEPLYNTHDSQQHQRLQLVDSTISPLNALESLQLSTQFITERRKERRKRRETIRKKTGAALNHLS